MRLSIIGLLVVLIAGLSCSHNGRPTRLRTHYGTCEATCQYYDHCKGSSNEERHNICVAECRNIFSEDGVMDKDALLQLQRLECAELLAYIDG